MHVKEIKERIEQTNLNKYGCISSCGNKEVREKQKETYMQNHKENVGIYKEYYTDEQFEIINSKEKFKKFLEEIPFEQRTIRFAMEKLGIKYHSTFLRHYYDLGLGEIVSFNKYISNSEKSVLDYINSLNLNNVISNYRKLLKEAGEIDIFLPDYNLGIEFNGNYWHSELKKDYNYHQIKSLKFKENGIFIYHIWEYDWNNEVKQKIIKSQIRNLLKLNERKIYARKCKIKEISAKESREFLNENHLQGNRNSKYKFGLFYNNELVSVMTFGYSWINKNSNKEGCYELLRFCNKLNTSVVGGQSKLFKYFINNYNPKEILSYCSIDSGNGNSYYNLGFKLDKITEPNYGWLNYCTSEYKTRYQCQMKNENEIMRDNGYVKISNCGNYKFIWKAEDVL